jgi:membrane associated rhomboid family serine protease
MWSKKSSSFEPLAPEIILMRLSVLTVTNVLVAINLAIAVVLLWPGLFEPALVAGALFPARLIDGDAGFAGAGAMLPAIVTPVSSAFLHGGMMHAFLNMLMLFITGRMLEKVLGWPSFLLLYVAGMLAAAAAEIIAAPHSTTPMVGASGAISAVIAAFAVLFPNKEPKKWGMIPARNAHQLHLLAGWVLVNAMLVFAAPQLGFKIAFYAHIGGFAAGLLLARPLLLWRYRNA